MIDKLEETVHNNEVDTLFCKTIRLNWPENYVLTQNCFNADMVLLFNGLNEIQISKMPCRHRRHCENEKFVNLKIVELFKSNKNKNFWFEIEDKK